MSDPIRYLSLLIDIPVSKEEWEEARKAWDEPGMDAWGALIKRIAHRWDPADTAPDDATEREFGTMWACSKGCRCTCHRGPGDKWQWQVDRDATKA